MTRVPLLVVLKAHRACVHHPTHQASNLAGLAWSLYQNDMGHIEMCLEHFGIHEGTANVELRFGFLILLQPPTCFDVPPKDLLADQPFPTPRAFECGVATLCFSCSMSSQLDISRKCSFTRFACVAHSRFELLPLCMSVLVSLC